MLLDLLTIIIIGRTAAKHALLVTTHIIMDAKRMTLNIVARMTKHVLQTRPAMAEFASVAQMRHAAPEKSVVNRVAAIRASQERHALTLNPSSAGQ